MENNKNLVLIPTQDDAEKLNQAIQIVTGSVGVSGFQRAYLLADGIQKLEALLTPEYMSPIMAMQGKKLGFRSDKDKTGGYPMNVVKSCLIEAVLMGLEPYGNQFNIIAGNMYMTKEGAGHILNNYKGLSYDIVIGLPRVNAEKTSSAVEATINWTLNGKTNSKIIPIAIKMDAYTSLDAVIGKATRKARAWLISAITGIEVGEGDVTEEASATVVSSKSGKKDDKEAEKERILALIKEAQSIEELEFYLPEVTEETRPAFDKRHQELIKAKK